MRREYQGLSRRTRLLLNQSEGGEVEFKRTVGAVKQKILISFANSATGGTVLVGVDDGARADGVQRGQITGCDVSDSARLQIQNKALSCIPPITIQIITENLAHRPLLRIEIPSSQNKPHCSQSGDYCIRSDGRNRALQPDEMLHLFMERESEQFLIRFKHAVSKLESQVTTMDSELRLGVDQMLDDMHRLDRDTMFILNELYGRSMDMRNETAASRQHDTALDDKLRRIKRSVDRKYKDLAHRVGDLSLKIDALLARFSIEDPLRRRAHEQVTEMASLIRERDNPALLDDFLDVLSHMYPDIDRETLQQWVRDAMDGVDAVKASTRRAMRQEPDDS